MHTTIRKRANRNFFTDIRRALIVCASLLFSLSSCKKDLSAGSTTDFTTKEPHVIKGTIYGADGKVINIPGAQVYIYISGIGASGDNVSYTAQMDANGHYRIQVSDGAYIFDPQLNVMLSGFKVNIRLSPTDATPLNVSEASKPGILKNFQLHLTGLMPDMDPNNVYSYYGGHIQLEDGLYWHTGNGYFDNLSTRYPNAKEVAVSVVPKTPVVDGSQGQAITMHTDLQKLKTTNDYFVNIPFAGYEAAAVLVMNDGSSIPLQVSIIPDTTPLPTTTVLFKPDPADPYMFPGFPIIDIWDR